MSRVPFLSRSDLPPQHQWIYEDIASKRGRVPRPFGILLHSPEAAMRVAAVGAYLRFDSALDPALRELAILATSREMHSQYEFTHHVPLARDAGVREEAIAALQGRRPLERLTSEEALVLRYTRQLLRHRRISERTFQALLQRLGTKGLVDLTVTIGYYCLLAHAIEAFAVDLEPEVVPLLPAKPEG